MNFQPLTVAECRELTGAYYRRIQQSMLTQSSRTTRSVMGWSDGTLVDGSVISISMQKDLVGHTPLELSSRSWDLCLDAGSNDLYSSEFTSTAECLQVVDQDNLVIYERIARGGPDDVAHSIFLVSRIKIDDGYMEITQPLDRSRLALSPAESTGKWIDSDLWYVASRRLYRHTEEVLTFRLQDHVPSVPRRRLRRARDLWGRVRGRRARRGRVLGHGAATHSHSVGKCRRGSAIQSHERLTGSTLRHRLYLLQTDSIDWRWVASSVSAHFTSR